MGLSNIFSQFRDVGEFLTKETKYFILF